MRIGIDGRFLLEKNLTGVGEYALGMIEQLADFFSQDQLLIFLNSFHPIDEEKLDFFKKIPNVKICYFHFPNKLLNLVFFFLAWPKIDRMLGGVDVFFLPNLNFSPLSKKCKVILAVHDLSFEHWAETFSWKRRLWHFLINPRQLCRRADMIWAVSESTKEDLKSLYNIEEEKISVVYSPFDWDFFAKKEFSELAKEKLIKKYALPKNFILSLNTIEPRKNLISLIKAFEFFQAKAVREDEETFLVIAGGKGWLWKEIFSRINSSPVKDKIIFIGFVKREEKPLLYRLAKVFVYPSLFEGFGYPPLEAMASGTPVIVSNNSSLNEIVDNSGILINPFRPFEIYLALKELFSSNNLIDFYSLKGRIQAKKIQEEGTIQAKKVFELI